MNDAFARLFNRTDKTTVLSSFPCEIFGLDLAMDHGWIGIYTAAATMQVPGSFASEGGSGTPVPDLSIEVDDLELVLDRVRESGRDVEYGPVNEPWGVRRFYVRDPNGKLLNVLHHAWASARARCRCDSPMGGA